MCPLLCLHDCLACYLHIYPVKCLHESPERQAAYSSRTEVQPQPWGFEV